MLDVSSGELVDGPVDRARYSPVAWVPGGAALYYVRRLAPELLPEDERQYHRRVWLHRVGTDAAEDVEVFGAGLDMTNYYGVSVSRDGRWLIVSASAGTAPRTDVWIADLSEPGATTAPRFVPVAVGLDAEVGAWVGRDGRLYVHTNLDAPRGRLVVTDPTRPGVEHWRTLLAEDPEAVLEDVAFTDGGGADSTPVRLLRLVAAARRERGLGARPVDGHPPRGGRHRGAPRAGLDLRTGHAPRRRHGRLVLLHRPRHGADRAPLDTTTGTTSLWAAPPGALADLPDVVVRQIEVTSADGTTVRAFVIARRDALDADGNPTAPAPTVLYGYGGFQISLDPAYSASTLAWVEAGGVYVVANLRGGGEEGESWHRDGMRAHKQHVFDDFHAVAEHLVATGWTTPDAAGVLGRVERRAARGRGPDPAAGPVRRGRVLGPAPRHGPVPALRPGRHLDRGVRGRGHRRGARLAARVLAVPPRRRRHRLPGHAVHGLRGRHPCRPAARPQARRGAAGCHLLARGGPTRCSCAGRPGSATAAGRCRARSG